MGMVQLFSYLSARKGLILLKNSGSCAGAQVGKYGGGGFALDKSIDRLLLDRAIH